MANGVLGKAVSVANTNVTVYTVPAAISYTMATIAIVNRGSADVTAQVAVGFTDTPDTADWIEYGVVIPASGGIYERACVAMSPGEKVVVKGTTADLNIRVYGLEEQ